ncbi:hypothetical protein C5167_008769 [Papaver somniferum]|uniref:Uncharacterized protein n=1 Tax=Papaver somniferum TaxID=3469 RepID=A0A4Y7JWK9_PAPSO|nr:hypothetical protein C5167_008769 [Papaver somniferum]
MESRPEVVDDDAFNDIEPLVINNPEGKLHEEVEDSLKRKRESPFINFALEASLSAGLISSLPDQSSSKRPKLDDHTVQASYERLFKLKLADPSSASIQLIRDSTESRHYMKALKHIKALQSEFPSSALVLALKVLVYAIIGGEVGVSSVLSKTEAKVFSDISAFPDVLTTFEAVWLHLGHRAFSFDQEARDG